MQVALLETEPDPFVGFFSWFVGKQVPLPVNHVPQDIRYKKVYPWSVKPDSWAALHQKSDVCFSLPRFESHVRCCYLDVC